MEVRLKDIAQINRRTLPESTNPDYTFRYVDIGAINEFGEISIPEEPIRFGSAPSRARRVALPGSTVVSTVRTYLRAVARAPETTDPLIFSTGFAVIEPLPGIDPRFLNYYCQSEPFIQDVAARSVGVSYPAINASELGTIKLDLPPLEEQRRIADFLDHTTRKIKRIDEIRKKQLALLHERTDAFITETLIPGTLSNPCGEWPWRWLPLIDDDTPLVRLRYVSRLQSGLTIDGSRPLDGDAVTRPYLRVANVQAGWLDLSSVTEITVPKKIAKRCTLQPGDVLMTEGGDLDKLGRGTVWRGEIPNCLHQNHIFAVRPDPSKLDPDYLALMTRTLHGRCYFESTGTKTTNLASTSSAKILAFPIPLPGLKRQRQLVEQVHTELALIDAAKQAIEKQRSLLQERRISLITTAVTGQLDATTAREI